MTAVSSVKTRRNKALDLLKIIFMCIIILHHSNILRGILVRGYIAVEFFFIVSGYLMFKSYEKKPDISIGEFLVKRVKAYYPLYIISTVMMFVQYMLAFDTSPYNEWFRPVAEVLLVQEFLPQPLAKVALNYPMWYMSVLMWVGFIIFLVMRKMPRKVFNVLSVLFVLAVYAYLITHSPATIEHWGGVKNLLRVTLLRGGADILIGILLAQLPNPKGKGWIAAELLSFFGIVFLLFTPGAFDYISVVLIIILIYSVLSEKSVIAKIGNNKFAGFLIKYEYAAFVIHAFMIRVIWLNGIMDRHFNKWIVAAALLVCTWIVGIVLSEVYKLLCKLITPKEKKTQYEK